MILALFLAAAVPPPDLSGVIQLSLRNGGGQACPVSATEAYTAAHVVDPRPLDPESPLMSGMWGNEAGQMGVFRSIRAYGAIDLALISGNFPKWYPIATKAPNPGDRVWVVGYDWRRRTDMFAKRVWDHKVLRVVAGEVILEHSTDLGSSGSCVLNESGEAVAILGFHMRPENGSSDSDDVGGASGLWFLNLLAPKEEVVEP